MNMSKNECRLNTNRNRHLPMRILKKNEKMIRLRENIKLKTQLTIIIVCDAKCLCVARTASNINSSIAKQCFHQFWSQLIFGVSMPQTSISTKRAPDTVTFISIVLTKDFRSILPSFAPRQYMTGRCDAR